MEKLSPYPKHMPISVLVSMRLGQRPIHTVDVQFGAVVLTHVDGHVSDYETFTEQKLCQPPDSADSNAPDPDQT